MEVDFHADEEVFQSILFSQRSVSVSQGVGSLTTIGVELTDRKCGIDDNVRDCKT